MFRFLLIAGLALAAPAVAQEIVTLPTREGVTQSFFLPAMQGRKPEAVALLLKGGDGAINLRMEDGKPRFGMGNFLMRAHEEFVRNGIVAFVMDNPSDFQGGAAMPDHFRMGEAHAVDVRAVVAEARRRYPGLPVFLVGTSRSTLSAAHLGGRLGSDVAGVVLTSTVFLGGRRPGLASYDLASVKQPVLFVHHREDSCPQCPYTEAARLADRYPLVSVKGGKPPQSGPCDAFSAHGYFGVEAQTVDAIAAWMLGRTFPREVE